MPRTSILVAGVILSAGRSSRMGAPKALLTLEGRSFLSRLVDAFRAGGCAPILVVTGPESDEDAREIAAAARRLGARPLANPNRGSDQIESLRIALRDLSSEFGGVVVSPVDAPGASASVVAALIEAAGTHAPIAIPTYHGRRGHPILFARELFDDLMQEALPEGARTVIRRYEREVVEIPVTEPGVLLDVDTPEEYEQLRRESE